jgi:hypothetical protein
LVFQKRIEARCHKKDRYGREVCAMYVDLRDVGLEQMRQGMAWHYKEYQHEQTTQDRLVYRDEEESAKGAASRAMEGREAGAALGVEKTKGEQLLIRLTVLRDDRTREGEEMSATDVFNRLGAPLTHVYGWAAESPDGKRAVFTMWDDETKPVVLPSAPGEKPRRVYEIILWPTRDHRPRPEGEYGHDDRFQARQMRDIAERALARGAECLGVVIFAKDTETLGARERADVDERDVRRLQLRRDGERIIARVVGKVSISEVAK